MLANCCVAGYWTNWTSCSEPCDGGLANREYIITQTPKNGGLTCPASTTETKTCNPNACCQTGAWSDWGTCTGDCAVSTTEGEKSRNRLVIPLVAGRVCPSENETATCPMDCKEDCIVGAWDDWSGCPACSSNGNLSETRTRPIVSPPKYGGESCPVVKQMRDCSPAECEKTCTFGGWGDWSICNQTCGTGWRERTRLPLGATAVARKNNASATAVSSADCESEIQKEVREQLAH